MTTDTTTPTPPETAVRTSDDLVEFRSANDFHANVHALAAAGKVIDTRYVGIWAYINIPCACGCSHNPESIAEALNIDLSFAHDAMSHFAEVGCLVHDGTRWFITDMPFRAYLAGITDVDMIREAAIKDKQREAKRRERAAAPARPTNQPQRIVYLYVIGEPESNVVKIGISQDLPQRLDTLRKASPQPIELLWSAVGSYDIEQKLHGTFHKYRTHGEWFNFGDLSAPVTAIRREALRLGAMEVAE